MASNKRDRRPGKGKQAAHARRRAAEMARRKRVRKRRLNVASIVAVIAAVGVVGFLLINNGGNEETNVSTSPSSTTASTPTTKAGKVSAAGKPCVPVADPLPPGAPAVPVKVGPPPPALVTEDVKPGTGPVVTPGQTLTVNYIGVSCSTGKIFDSSYKGGKPATFPLSGVIPGWQEGIPGMKVGGQRLLGIPPDKGYGEGGSGSDIGPGETLWFVVEVLEAKAA